MWLSPGSPGNPLAPPAPAAPAGQQATATATAAPAPSSPYGNIGAPNEQYLTNVSASAVGTALNDLSEFGLSPAAAQQAVNWYTTETKNLVDPAQMQIDMYQQPWFQGAFPGIIQQIKNGQTPMTPADYVAFKQGVVDFNRQFGVPDGFVSPADIGNMVGNGWTFTDYTNRMGMAFNASAQAVANNPEAMDLLDQWYGLKPGTGALAAFYLDPTKTVNLLAQATTGAQAGAFAENAGFTKLDQGTLMGLAANSSLSAIESGVTGAVPLLPTTEAFREPGQSFTMSQKDLLASQVGGVPGQPPVKAGEAGVPPVTQQHAQEELNVAVGQRTSALHGGGGLAGQGQPGQSGAGYGTQ